MAYDDQNVFAKILRGELPSSTIYEDEKTLAIMDIMPRAKGHALVIPKAPARNLLDCDQADLAACMATVKKVAAAAMQAFSSDGVTLLQASEASAGQEVFHLHFHVIPRFDGVKLGQPASNMESPEVLAANAEKYATVLGA